MTPIIKNLLILLFFLIFVSYIGPAEAAQGHYDIFWNMQGDTSFVNWTALDRCCLFYYCEIV